MAVMTVSREGNQDLNPPLEDSLPPFEERPTSVFSLSALLSGSPIVASDL
jgi:hypothetical protein